MTALPNAGIGLSIPKETSDLNAFAGSLQARVGLSAKLGRKIRSRRHARTAPIALGDVSEEGKGRTALITGASSGIGWSISELLAAKGYDLIVVSRREVRLEALRRELEGRWNVRVFVLVFDLGGDGAAQNIHRQLLRQGLTVDFLVNCAGYALSGPYLSHSWEEQAQFVNVMAINVAQLCRFLLPTMLERGWGRVLNVSSLAALMPGTPNMVLYAASKAFVEKMTEGLAMEYQQAGINCTVSLPGITDTELLAEDTFSAYTESSLLVQLAVMRPETVARQAYLACMQGRYRIVHGWHNRVWAFSLTHMPHALRYRMSTFTARASHHKS
jgi:hypothetical protein